MVLVPIVSLRLDSPRRALVEGFLAAAWSVVSTMSTNLRCHPAHMTEPCRKVTEEAAQTWQPPRHHNEGLPCRTSAIGSFRNGLRLEPNSLSRSGVPERTHESRRRSAPAHLRLRGDSKIAGTTVSSLRPDGRAIADFAPDQRTLGSFPTSHPGSRPRAHGNAKGRRRRSRGAAGCPPALLSKKERTTRMHCRLTVTCTCRGRSDVSARMVVVGSMDRTSTSSTTLAAPRSTRPQVIERVDPRV